MELISIQDGIVLISLLISLYLFFELNDIGLAIVAPILIRNKGDRKVLATISKPAFECNECWALAALPLVLVLFPEGWNNYRGLYLILYGIMTVGMLLRTLSAWLFADESSLSKALTWLNSLIMAIGIFLLSLVGTSILLNAGLGILGLDTMFPSALGVVGGLWTLLAFAIHGAIYVSHRTTNPLAERARAMALVGTVLEIFTYLILLASVYVMSVLPGQGETTFFIGTSISLSMYILVFILLRLRKLPYALLTSYLGSGLILVAYTITLNRILTLEKYTEGTTMQVSFPEPVWVFIAVGAVGTLISHWWKFRRPKEESPKNFKWGEKKSNII